MIKMIVDSALSEVPINAMPLIDDTDFKTREESVVYNQAGLDLVWNFVTAAGAFTQTAVTPTDTAGNYDWVNQGNGMYSIEIPASGGASINNDTEGYGWFTGYATGILPWAGPKIQFSPANVVNSMVTGSDLLDVNTQEWNDLTTVALPLVPTTAGRTLDVSTGGEAGIDWANIGSPTTANNLSATNIDVDQVVASVSGAVGSVTGAVGSVTGAVGSVASGGITAASIADGAIDRATFAADTGLQSIRSNTAAAGAATTITLDASASAVDDFYTNTLIYLTGGTGVGQGRFITDYVGSTKVATVSTWITNPDNTSTFAIIPLGGASAPTSAEVADAVWDEDATAHQTTGTFGQAIGDPGSDTNTIFKAVVTDATGATVGVDVVAMKVDTAAILVDTGTTLDARIPAALSAGGNMKADVLSLGGVVQSLTDLKDFADDGYDPSTNKVQGVVLTDTVTTYTGNTVQTGDAFARLGAPAGASVSADILVIDNLVDDLESRVGTPSNLGGGATVAANLADIEGQTDDIGTAGAGLTAVPWNAAWDAEVQSEVNDAINEAISELGVATPTATPTIRTAIMLMYMALRNKLVVQTSGTDAIEIYNDAGTKIASKLITDTGSDYTEAEMT